MTTQYGICYGQDADTTIEECDSLEAAHTRARAIAGTGIEVDVVELEGTGPCYADDGSQISDTHAPRCTVQTYVPPTTESAAVLLGRKGGQVKSEAKKDAVRKNAKAPRPNARKPFAWLVVRTAFHGGGIVSRHRTEQAATLARDRWAGAECRCGCAKVIPASEYDSLPSACDDQPSASRAARP